MTQSAPPAPANDLEKIQEQYQEILNSFQSIQLATVSTVCEPTASYSPSVIDDEGNFYIYVSEIADHTPNLLANGQASILIIEDEGTAGQIFARKRLGFKALAKEVDRGSEAWESILDKFVAKFGRVMEHLKTMEDFH
ncbi:MAG: HugZ family protein, partial [Puniceicoccales bacterium]